MANRIFKQECRNLLVRKSVIANYGNKNVYIVQDINYENGPCNELIVRKDGKKMSIAKYFM